MADTNTNKMLVAIDGSDRSIRTVKYLAEMPAFFNKEIHLFNVFASIPESYYDLGKEPGSIKVTSGLYAWESEQRSQIEKHMQKCRKILEASDFNPRKIKTVIHKRRKGVARDIIAESKKGYDAVVIRRRGMSNLQSLVMGGVALKLLNGITSTPLIFAGRKPCNRRFLIGVDGSDNALRAVDFVGSLLAGQDCDVELISVLRKGDGKGNKGVVNLELEREVADTLELQCSGNLETAGERLIQAGVKASCITTRIIHNAASRAGAIVDAAEADGFDTIVVGRRGLSRVQQFFAGRVSTKILHIGRKHHVWIVS